MATDLKQVDIRLAVSKNPYGDEPVKIRCIQHNDPSASMCVYHSHIHCFGCGFRIARRMESLAYLLSIPLSEAIKRAGEFIGRKEEERGRPPPGPLPSSLVSVYESFLFGRRADRLEWLFARGLTLETIKRFHLGHDGTRFVIPVFSRSRELITFRFRRDDFWAVDDERKYSGVRGRNDTYLYPAWMLDLAFDSLVVCEGELDAVRLWQEGIPAVSPTNGSNAMKQVPELLTTFKHIRRLVIASDQDEAGEKGSDDLINAAQGKYKCKRIKWDISKGKDVTEWFNDDKKAIQSIRSNT